MSGALQRLGKSLGMGETAAGLQPSASTNVLLRTISKVRGRFSSLWQAVGAGAVCTSCGAAVCHGHAVLICCFMQRVHLRVGLGCLGGATRTAAR